MEVQTVEKKPNTGKQTVTATEETSSVAERTKEVIFFYYKYEGAPYNLLLILYTILLLFRTVAV